MLLYAAIAFILKRERVCISCLKPIPYEKLARLPDPILLVLEEAK